MVHATGAWLVAHGWADDATSFMALSVTGARTLLETFVTMNLSFLVFTFGSLLVAIQVAGGQYTPRIIATTLLRDNTIRVIVGVFLFTLAFAVRVLVRIDETARLLRPVSIVQRVGGFGVRVIQSVYPHPTTGTRPAVSVVRPRSPVR